jgi:nitrite reductase (NO-forming)
MNKVVMVGVVMGVLLAGLIFSPILLGKYPQQAKAQAQASAGKTKKILLVASEKEVQVAPDNALHPGGVKYNAMVFNGTVPGPVVAIDQGDTLEITLRNDGKLVHSMDFHAGFGADKANSGPVKPGESRHGHYRVSIQEYSSTIAVPMLLMAYGSILLTACMVAL